MESLNSKLRSLHIPVKKKTPLEKPLYGACLNSLQAKQKACLETLARYPLDKLLSTSTKFTLMNNALLVDRRIYATLCSWFALLQRENELYEMTTYAIDYVDLVLE